jgi:hypothetical protein
MEVEELPLVTSNDVDDVDLGGRWHSANCFVDCCNREVDERISSAIRRIVARELRIAFNAQPFTALNHQDCDLGVRN